MHWHEIQYKDKINGYNYFQSVVVLNYIDHLRLINVIFISKYIRIENAYFSFKSRDLDLESGLDA